MASIGARFALVAMTPEGQRPRRSVGVIADSADPKRNQPLIFLTDAVAATEAGSDHGYRLQANRRCVALDVPPARAALSRA